MRIKLQDDEPKVGDTRVVDRFLLFPVCIGGDLRWLERAKIKERYICPDPQRQRAKLPFYEWKDASASPTLDHDSRYHYEWHPVKFADNDKE